MEHEQSSHHYAGYHHEGLIRQNSACAVTGENCGASCPGEEDVDPMGHCMKPGRDCAKVCSLAARHLTRQVNFLMSF